MKKIIIIVFIVFLSGTAYADSAWDRMVQESESCAMAAYDISPTPISREVSRDKVIEVGDRHMSKNMAEARIARHILSTKDRDSAHNAQGATHRSGITPGMNCPRELPPPPINRTEQVTTITYVYEAVTYYPVPCKASIQPEMTRNSTKQQDAVPVVAEGPVP